MQVGQHPLANSLQSLDKKHEVVNSSLAKREAFSKIPWTPLAMSVCDVFQVAPKNYTEISSFQKKSTFEVKIFP